MKFLSFIIIAALSSCAFWPVGPDYQKPEITMPKQWSGIEHTTSKKTQVSHFEQSEYHWWKNFKDPVLSRMVHIAIRNNYDFQIAQSRVIASRSNIMAVSSKYAPKADLKASGERSSNYLNFFEPDSKNKLINFFSTGFDASWELDLFGKNYRSRQAAKALYEASSDAKNYILVSLIAEVVKTYSQIRAAQNELIVEKKINHYYQEIAQLNKYKSKIGIISDIDFKRAKIDEINSQIAVDEVRARLKTSIHNLEMLLGKRPNTLRQLLSQKAEVPVLRNAAVIEAPVSLLRNRPDIRQAERELKAATNLKGVAMAKVFPTISLTGFFGLNNTKSHDILQSSSRVFSLGTQAQMPVLNFGGIIAGYKISEERRKQAVLKYKLKVNKALHDVESSLIHFSKEESKLDLNESKFQLSKTISYLNRRRHESGIITYCDYLISKIDVLENRRSVIQSQLDFAEKTISLYKSLGGGWQNIKEVKAAK